MAQSTTQSRGLALPPVTVTANSIVDQIRADAFSGTSAGATESQLRDQNAFDLVAAQRRTPGVQLSRYNPVGTFGGDAAPFISAVWRSAFPGVKSGNIDGIPFYMGVESPAARFITCQ